MAYSPLSSSAQKSLSLAAESSPLQNLVRLILPDLILAIHLLFMCCFLLSYVTPLYAEWQIKLVFLLLLAFCFDVTSRRLLALLSREFPLMWSTIFPSPTLRFKNSLWNITPEDLFFSCLARIRYGFLFLPLAPSIVMYHFFSTNRSKLLWQKVSSIPFLKSIILVIDIKYLLSSCLSILEIERLIKEERK